MVRTLVALVREEVAEFAGMLPNVILSRDSLYTCSEPGQEQIKTDIREQKLNSVSGDFLYLKIA